MIHQPSKYHSNPLTHFLNLHSPTGGSGINSPHSISNREDEEEIDVDSLHKSPEENTDLDAVSGSMGKSFTIAAILGLKAAAAVASINDNNNNSQSGFKAVGSANYPNGFSHHQQLQNQRHFTDVMNLSMNQSLLSLKPPNCNSFDSLSRMNGPYSGQSHFLPSNFQHSPNGHSTALQNLQKLHQQHVSNANSISVSNGFRILNRPPDSGGKSSSKSQSMKSKRVRTIFTPEQLERLEAEFERQQYMVGPERLYLAHTLQLTEAQVKVWFQNRRIKFRKHHLELTQQRLAMLRQRQIPSNGSQMQGSAQPNSMSHHRSNSNGLDLEEMALSPDSRDSSSSHEDHTSSTG